MRGSCRRHTPAPRLHGLAFATCGLVLSSFANAAEFPAAPGSQLEGNGNFVIAPEYQLDRDLTDQGNPHGRLFEFSMKLSDSAIFPGTDTTLEHGGQHSQGDSFAWCAVLLVVFVNLGL